MKEEKFDELWERAEAERYASEMVAEYPAWRTRQRKRMAVTAMVLVLVGAALPIVLTNSNKSMLQHDGYAVAYCNKNNISDQYWVDLAGEMLMEMV